MKNIYNLILAGCRKHKFDHLFIARGDKIFSRGKCSWMNMNKPVCYSLCAYYLYKLKNIKVKENYISKSKIYNVFVVKNCNGFRKSLENNTFKLQNRNYSSTNNKVYVKGEIYDIIPTLCRKKESKSISSNIIFFILKLLNSKNVATVEEYKENIKKIYFNLIKCYHKIFENNNGNVEYIFSIFNDDIIKNVSPSLRKKKRNMIQEIVLNSLDFFFKNNDNLKDKLDINLLCENIKYKKFLYILKCISYDKEKLKENINVQNVDYLFCRFLNDRIYFTSAIELSSLFVCEEHMTIVTPFKDKSAFNCLIILKYILQIQSKNSLFMFLDIMQYNHLKRGIFCYLFSVNRFTGLLLNYWGSLAAKEYLLLNQGREMEKVKKIEICNDEEINFKNGKCTNHIEGPRNNICKEYYDLPEEMKKNISILNNIEDLKKMVVEIEKNQKEYWVNNIYNNDDVYNVESNNNIITVDDINNHLRRKKKRYYIAIDVEWNRNQKVSIISIATNNRIYLIDLLNIDYNYVSLVYSFFKWLLENPFIYKLFYNFSCDMKILLSFFQNTSNGTYFVNVIDLKDPFLVHKNDGNNLRIDNNVMNFELLNRNILENSNVLLFKKVINNNPCELNKEIRHNISYLESDIITNSCKYTNKIYFKSLSDLCKKVLQKKLNKQLQLSNWKKRPLTRDQIEYAGIDSYVLIKIEEQLVENNYISICLSNSSCLINTFIQKYKFKLCSWE
ncbi:exonuclease, putative [Plasmodium malariae]|uniref:Exonuclease, putative n=1 Tax=Plasmodium malariae TaxID=5858 RepID=A0A1C3KZ68_PLAMA|nr:exonuclease, putative [Plasmodium malariae]